VTVDYLIVILAGGIAGSLSGFFLIVLHLLFRRKGQP